MEHEYNPPPGELTSNNIHDQCADSYGYRFDQTLSALLKYQLAAKYISTESRVLEVGCANGLYLVALAPKALDIVGADINDRMLALASSKIKELALSNARVEKMSATQLTFPDNSFDVVYSFSTLLLIPDVKKAITELVRVLKPGAIALLDITGKYNVSRVYWGLYYRMHGHFGVNAFRYPEIQELLTALGMDIIEKHALGFTDQYRYIPLLTKIKRIQSFFHENNTRDRDYRWSNHPALFPFANRWYIVARKIDTSTENKLQSAPAS